MAQLPALRKSRIFSPKTPFLWISRSLPRPEKRPLFPWNWERSCVPFGMVSCMTGHHIQFIIPALSVMIFVLFSRFRDGASSSRVSPWTFQRPTISIQTQTWFRTCIEETTHIYLMSRKTIFPHLSQIICYYMQLHMIQEAFFETKYIAFVWNDRFNLSKYNLRIKVPLSTITRSNWLVVGSNNFIFISTFLFN